MLIAALALVGRYAPQAARPGATGPAAAPADGGAADPGAAHGLRRPIPAYTVPADVARAREHIDRSGGDPGATLVTAYFADRYSRGTALVPVQIKVKGLPESPTGRAAALLPVLLDPPVALGLETGVPPGTRVGPGGVRLDASSGVLTVELTPAAENGSGEGWATSVLYSFVYTLTEIEGVQAVRLQVEGRPARLAGWTWDRPLGRADLERLAAMHLVEGVRYVREGG